MAHESILACLQGRTVYDLGVELYPGMPHHPFHAPFTFQLMREHGDLVFGGGVSSAVELFGMTGHTGTHLDGLGHFAKNLCLHSGISATQVQSKTAGFAAHGIETVPPILHRGVLLDVAAAQGVAHLGASQTIGPDDLEAAARYAGVEVRSGDVLLVRTGWLAFWPDQRRYYSVQTGVPGLSLDGARWATERGVYCIGSDNCGVEYLPAPENAYPVHVHCLTERGVHLMEVVNLEPLSQARVYEFLLLVVPMKIRGGTASPVRPLAVI